MVKRTDIVRFFFASFPSLRGGTTKQSLDFVILSFVEGSVRVPNVDASTTLSMTCGKIASFLAMTRLHNHAPLPRPTNKPY